MWAGSSVSVDVPVRLADVGGWTDTWFGSPGNVCHVAVGPGVEVRAKTFRESYVRVVAPNLELDYVWSEPPGVNRFLEGMIGDSRGIEIRVSSQIPPGASLGGSASVAVGIVAATRALAGEQIDPTDLARRAHEIETEVVGRESGVQDHWAAAFGGINLLSVENYPDVVREQIPPVSEIEGRLLTVVFHGHDSSQVHQQIIESLGPQHRSVFMRLGDLALAAATALRARDLATWASILVDATRVQEELDSRLTGAAHRAAIDVARRHGATGWKVNGAGGEGASLTIVVKEPRDRAHLQARLAEIDSSWLFPALEPTEGMVVRYG